MEPLATTDSMPCTLCKSASAAAFQVQEIEIRDCISCGHRFAGVTADEEHVASTYDDNYFYGGGAGYSDYSAEADLLIKRGVMYSQKLSAFTKPGRMLDVGAAAGFILKGFANKGWDGVGLEPNDSMAGKARSELGLDVQCGSLETYNADQPFDLVSMIQVAAHFYDPQRAFSKAKELLNNNGLLLIETWDRDSLSAKIFGKNWHEYSPPSVLNWFSKEGLDGYLDSIGFEKVAGGRPSKKISGGHVKSLLRYRLGDNLLLKFIPESINFPYPSEDLFWALYRKRS